jgi:hypothetical protein
VNWGRDGGLSCCHMSVVSAVSLLCICDVLWCLDQVQVRASKCETKKTPRISPCLLFLQMFRTSVWLRVCCRLQFHLSSTRMPRCGNCSAKCNRFTSLGANCANTTMFFDCKCSRQSQQRNRRTRKFVSRIC